MILRRDELEILFAYLSLGHFRMAGIITSDRRKLQAVGWCYIISPDIDVI